MREVTLPLSPCRVNLKLGYVCHARVPPPAARNGKLETYLPVHFPTKKVVENLPDRA